MAFAKVFTITCPASTGNATHAHGLGRAPKGLIAFGCNLTSVPGSSADANMMIGFADDTPNSEVEADFYEDGVTTSQAYYRQSTDTAKFFIYVTQQASIVCNGAVVSMDGTNVTINWANVTSGTKIFCLAIGGDHVFCKTGLSASTSGTPPFTQTITGVGIKPDVVLFTSNSAGATSGAGTTSSLSFGVSNTSNEGSVGTHRKNNRTDSNFDRNSCLLDRALIDHAGTVTNQEFKLTGISTEDQFTITWQDQDPGTTKSFRWMAIQGVDAVINTGYTQPSSTGNSDVTLTGITPEAILAFSWGHASTGERSNLDSQLSIGVGTSSSNRGCAYSGNEYGLSGVNMNGSQDMDDAALLKLMSPNGSTPTLNAEADLVSFAANKATINWVTINETAARSMVFLGLAEKAAPSPNLFLDAVVDQSPNGSSPPYDKNISYSLNGGSDTPNLILTQQLGNLSGTSHQQSNDNANLPFGHLSSTTGITKGAAAAEYASNSGTAGYFHDDYGVLGTNIGSPVVEAFLKTLTTSTITLQYDAVDQFQNRHLHVFPMSGFSEVKYVLFQSPNGGTPPVSQSVAHTLTGGAPDAIIFIPTLVSGTLHTSGAVGVGVGFYGKDDSSQASWAYGANKQGPNFNGQHGHSASHAILVYDNSQEIEKASVSSVDSTNVNLSWATVDNNQYWCLMICLRGVKARVFTDTAKTSTTGIKSKALSGFGLPQLVITASDMATANGADGTLGWGVANAIESLYMCQHVDDAGNSAGYTDTYCSAAAVAVISNNGTGTPNVEAEAKLWAFADNLITWNWTTVHASNAYRFGGLVMRAVATGTTYDESLSFSADAAAAETQVQAVGGSIIQALNSAITQTEDNTVAGNLSLSSIASLASAGNSTLENVATILSAASSLGSEGSAIASAATSFLISALMNGLESPAFLETVSLLSSAAAEGDINLAALGISSFISSAGIVLSGNLTLIELQTFAAAVLILSQSSLITDLLLTLPGTVADTYLEDITANVYNELLTIQMNAGITQNVQSTLLSTLSLLMDASDSRFYTLEVAATISYILQTTMISQIENILAASFNFTLSASQQANLTKIFAEAMSLQLATALNLAETVAIVPVVEVLQIIQEQFKANIILSSESLLAQINLSSEQLIFVN